MHPYPDYKEQPKEQPVYTKSEVLLGLYGAFPKVSNAAIRHAFEVRESFWMALDLISRVNEGKILYDEAKNEFYVMYRNVIS